MATAVLASAVHPLWRGFAYACILFAVVSPLMYARTAYLSLTLGHAFSFLVLNQARMEADVHNVGSLRPPCPAADCSDEASHQFCIFMDAPNRPSRSPIVR